MLLGLAAGVRRFVVAVATVGAGVGALVGARLVLGRMASAPRPLTVPSRLAADIDKAVLHVPYLPGAIVLDGDTDDPGWTRPPGPARTGDFVSTNGAPARPFSEVRALWGDGHLYLCLYAADNDIESRTEQPDGPLWLDDSFRVTFARDGVAYVIEVSPRAVVTDSIRRTVVAPDYSWNSGVHVSRELDATLNNPKDQDEEWLIEMAVPLESIGLKGDHGESIGFSVTRCDTPKDEAAHMRSVGRGRGTREGRIVLE